MVKLGDCCLVDLLDNGLAVHVKLEDMLRVGQEYVVGIEGGHVQADNLLLARQLQLEDLLGR